MGRNLVKQKIGRFDQIKILTTRNVSYISAPPGTEITPNGVWSVATVISQEELLCVRKNITIRIPIKDVLKIADYNLSDIMKNLGKLSHGKSKKD